MIRTRDFSGGFQRLSQEVTQAKSIFEKGEHFKAIEIIEDLRKNFFDLDDAKLDRIKKQGWEGFIRSSKPAKEALEGLCSLLFYEGFFKMNYGKDAFEGRSCLILAKKLIEQSVHPSTFSWGQLGLLNQIHALLEVH